MDDLDDWYKYKGKYGYISCLFPRNDTNIKPHDELVRARLICDELDSLGFEPMWIIFYFETNKDGWQRTCVGVYDCLVYNYGHAILHFLHFKPEEREIIHQVGAKYDFTPFTEEEKDNVRFDQTSPFKYWYLPTHE